MLCTCVCSEHIYLSIQAYILLVVALYIVLVLFAVTVHTNGMLMRNGAYPSERKNKHAMKSGPGWARSSKKARPGNRGEFLLYSVEYGALAQLASALPWHGRGHRFESDMLHQIVLTPTIDLVGGCLFLKPCSGRSVG